LKNKDLEKFLFLTKSQKETDFTDEENPSNTENYERNKERLLNFTGQESPNNNITNSFDLILIENNMFDNNFLYLNGEEDDDKILNSVYFNNKPKENNKKIFIILKEKIQPKNGIKRGRKPKKESGKGKHSRNDEDNIIRKIKAHFFKYVNETLNKAIKSTWHKFENIPYDIIRKSSNEYNIHLMNSTIKEIYEASIHYVDKYERKNYERNKWALEYFSKEENEDKEKEVINLLNLNFIQFFDIFRKEYLPTFLDEINPLSKNKKPNNDKKDKSNVDEKIDEEEVNQYLTKVENICNNFETLLLNKQYSSKK